MAGTLYKKALKLITKELDKDAKNVLNECIQEITYTHQTHNLYDSYGYGIYIEGKLEKIGYLSSSPKATKGKNWYGEEIKGREEINDYLKNDYSPSGVIDLAVVATMPYAKILEDGGGNLKQSYRVISMSFQKLQDLSNKYNGTVKVIRK
nr:MAG TPA: hypothetical protein [Caudoviricetes sp.]